MLSRARRGRPSLAVNRGAGVVTRSLPGVAEGAGGVGDGVGEGVGDGVREAADGVAEPDAEGADVVLGESLHEASDPAAVTTTAAVRSAPRATRPPYDSHPPAPSVRPSSGSAGGPGRAVTRVGA